MKKRILAMLLALTMMVSCLPVVTLAEEQPQAHIHCECGKQTTLDAVCASCGTKAVEWTGVDMLPTVAGHYYLTKDVSAELVEYTDVEVSVCLHGKNITSTNGERIMTVAAGNARVSITDCAEVQGSITGGKTNKYGSALRVNMGATLILYGGNITGNTAPAGGDGTVYVGEGNATTAGGAFYMYGGMITGNTARRGSGVFIANPGTTKKPGSAHILGGSITGNTGIGTGGTKGGAGILAFGPVEIGGNAVISGNTAAEGPGDIYLRDSGYPGALTVSSQKPLTNGAKVEFGNDSGTLTSLSGSPAQWNCHWLTYGGENVSYANGAFVLGHYHGDQKYEPISGNAAVRDFTGYGYLTKDLTLGGPQTWKKDKTLCLNGYNITAKAGNRVFSTENASPVTVTIQDCTAYTDETGVYHAGKLTGGSPAAGTAGGAIGIMAGSSVCLQDGIITGNTSAIGGGALLVNGLFTMEGGEISHNTAKDGDTWKNGGAIYMNRDGKVVISGGKITGNQGAKGSVLYSNSTSTLELLGGKITGNTAYENGAFYIGSGVAVSIAGGPVVYDNLLDQAQSNLYLTGSHVLTVGTLAEAAKLGVSAEAADRAITGQCADYSTQITSDDPNYKVFHKEGALFLGVPITHIHRVCNDSTCTEHPEVGFAPWTSTNSLPESGNYYLTEDVVLTKQAILDNSEVNLCLNGKTVKVKEGAQLRFFYLKGNSRLTITDCAATPGTLTGAVKSAIMTENAEEAAPVINLWNGILTGNRGEAGGGAVMLQGKATFHMYGGVLTENSTGGTLGGGAVSQYSKDTAFYMYGGEITHNTATQTEDEKGGTGGAVYARGIVQILGGKISNNKADRLGGAILGDGSSAVITVESGVIEGNEAKAGGGLMIQSKAKLTVTGGTITGNSATSGGAGIYVSTGTTFAMQGGELTGNVSEKSGGGLYILRSEATVSAGKITDNQAGTTGGGIYVSGATLTVSGGTITGNLAGTHGGGISLAAATAGEQEYPPVLTLTGGQITNNTAQGLGGGIYVPTNAKQVSLSGTPVVSDNSPGNLYLNGQQLLLVGAMEAPARVGISAAQAFRAISQELDTDLSGYFFSDDKNLVVIYRDKTLYLDTNSTHIHCACTAQNNNCDHASIKFAPWDKTDSLPTSGNYYLTADVVLTGETSVSKDLNLCLNGFTVKAAQDKRILSTPKDAGVTLMITDCAQTAGKLTGGKDLSTAGAGAIFIRSGNTMRMFGGEITGNTSVTAGGAIVIAGGSKLELHGGKIYENSARSADGQTVKNGGGIFLNAGATYEMTGGLVAANEGALGGGIYANKAELTITGGEITGNQANQGGGIYCTGESRLTLRGGSMVNNQAVGNGGGLYMATGTQLTMEGGTLKNNTAGSNGGGLYILKQAVTLKGEICDNSATAGGGIFSNGAELVLTELTISGNKATEGAGIYANTPGNGTENAVVAAILVEKGTVISGNRAQKNGGAILLTGTGAQLTVKDGKITENSSKNAGGVLLLGSSTMTLSGGTISGNSATSGGGIYISTNGKLVMTGGSVSNNRATKNAGGIYLLRSEAALQGGTVSGNQAEGGGGIYAAGAKLVLSGTKVSGNVAAKNGGAIMALNSSLTKNGVKTLYPCTVDMNAGSLTGNSAINAGGVLVQGTGTVFRLSGGSISANKATSTGGGVYVSTNGTFYMTGGSISGNSTDKYGGGLWANKATVKLEAGQISGNSVPTSGGGVVAANQSKVELGAGLQVFENTAKAAAGLLCQGRAVLTVDGTEVYGNVSTALGAGLYVSTNSTTVVKNANFHDNRSGSNGGGLYCNQNAVLEVENTRIENNTAVAGAGLFNRGRTTVKGCTVTANKAEGDGGGLGSYKMAFKGGLFVEDSQITGNRAGGRGAGIFFSLGCFGSVKQVTLENNTSGAEGGALWAKDELQIDGLTATGNTSGGEGYAVYLAESDYDGQSYIAGAMKMSGDVIVKDNKGGDMYLGEQTTIAIPGGVIGEKTYIHITLASGLLTQKVFGRYDYEGGDLVYTITYGDRSMTDPEVLPAEQEPEQQPTQEDSQPAQTEGVQPQTEADNTLLYLGIAGIAAVILLAAIVLVMVKRKKTAKGSHGE